MPRLISCHGAGGYGVAVVSADDSQPPRLDLDDYIRVITGLWRMHAIERSRTAVAVTVADQVTHFRDGDVEGVGAERTAIPTLAILSGGINVGAVLDRPGESGSRRSEQ